MLVIVALLVSCPVCVCLHFVSSIKAYLLFSIALRSIFITTSMQCRSSINNFFAYLYFLMCLLDLANACVVVCTAVA